MHLLTTQWFEQN